MHRMGARRRGRMERSYLLLPERLGQVMSEAKSQSDNRQDRSTSAKHSPLPWRVGDAGHTVFAAPGSSPLMVAQRIQPANSEHIVRCVNAHAALVAALKRLVTPPEGSEMALGCHDRGPHFSAMQEAYEKARE